MVTYSFPTKIIKTIRKDDPDFNIDNGLVIAPRAGFEISNKCPSQYKLMITEAIKNGWLQPVAYMKDSEYMWEKLKD
jgi:hypothetical protein